MKRSNRLILLIGVFLAAAAFVLVLILIGGNGGGGGGGGPTAPPTTLATVVAARDIPLGVTVTTAMVATQEILIENRSNGAFGDVSQAIGQVVRQSIARGQQVTTFQFADLGSAARLECPAGFTCIAVQVDQVSGVGTLIKSGDFVDMVAAVGTTDPKFPIFDSDTIVRVPTGDYDPTSVKVLLQGMQVVATLLPPPPATETGVATPVPGSGTTSLNGQQEIVILAVTPQQAEVIKFVQLDGSITLTLRSPKDFVDASGNPIIPEIVPTTGIILKNMVSLYGVLTPEIITFLQPTPAP
ncbi:MAG: Flp pilus assembly protein CpaB [Chloroflexi bacterium]|nr:Flp pilus assembly protein CpaB [Chloroflexota bacterium]